MGQQTQLVLQISNIAFEPSKEKQYRFLLCIFWQKKKGIIYEKLNDDNSLKNNFRSQQSCWKIGHNLHYFWDIQITTHPSGRPCIAIYTRCMEHNLYNQSWDNHYNSTSITWAMHCNHINTVLERRLATPGRPPCPQGATDGGRWQSGQFSQGRLWGAQVPSLHEKMQSELNRGK
jgi:hypothetical protein